MIIVKNRLEAAECIKEGELSFDIYYPEIATDANFAVACLMTGKRNGTINGYDDVVQVLNNFSPEVKNSASLICYLVPKYPKFTIDQVLENEKAIKNLVDAGSFNVISIFLNNKELEKALIADERVYKSLSDYQKDMMRGHSKVFDKIDKAYLENSRNKMFDLIDADKLIIEIPSELRNDAKFAIEFIDYAIEKSNGGLDHMLAENLINKFDVSVKQSSDVIAHFIPKYPSLINSFPESAVEVVLKDEKLTTEMVERGTFREFSKNLTAEQVAPIVAADVRACAQIPQATLTEISNNNNDAKVKEQIEKHKALEYYKTYSSVKLSEVETEYFTDPIFYNEMVEATRTRVLNEFAGMDEDVELDEKQQKKFEKLLAKATSKLKVYKEFAELKEMAKDKIAAFKAMLARNKEAETAEEV